MENDGNIVDPDQNAPFGLHYLPNCVCHIILIVQLLQVTEKYLCHYDEFSKLLPSKHSPNNVAPASPLTLLQRFVC